MPDPKETPPDGPFDPARTGSINEPPGSNVYDVTVPPAPVEQAAKQPEQTDDPDDLEEEIEDAEDDGDVTIHHRTTTVKKKKR